MSEAEFYEMTPRTFANKSKGFAAMVELKERGEWERTRWQTAMLLNVHVSKGKKIRPIDLFRFPDEIEEGKITLEKHEIMKTKFPEKWPSVQ